MSTPTSVDKLKNEFQQLLIFLEDNQELSLRSDAENIARKSLLLAIASFFETRISEHILNFADRHSESSDLIKSFIQNAAINRRYFQWFRWDSRNANTFYSLFGPAFKEHMETRIKDDRELGKGVKDFLELGDDRNRLVHQNYASFSLEKTTEDIYESYKSAMNFVEYIPKALDECSSGEAAE